MRRIAHLVLLAAAICAAPGPLHAQLFKIHPLLSEVRINADGSTTAWFGYYNAEADEIPVPLGSSNYMGPSAYQGQPLSFLTGYHPRAFSVTFTSDTIGWTLLGQSVVARGPAKGPLVPVDPAAAALRVQQGGEDVLVVTAQATELRAPGGVRLYSDAARTAGVALAPGSGSWSSLSDRAAKRDFLGVDGEDVLARLRDLPIHTWSYLGQDPSIRHMGPTAQDFRRAFGLGDDERTIATVDLDGVALAALQALEARTRALEARLARCEAPAAPAPPRPERAAAAEPISPAADSLLVVRVGGEEVLWLDDQVLRITAPAGLRISTDTAWAGATLPPGAGSWSITSDAAAKRDLRPVDAEAVLAALRALPIATWRYAGRAGVRHLGPTAQDFRAAFGMGEGDRTISGIDADGVALAGVRALESRTRALEARLDAAAGCRGS